MRPPQCRMSILRNMILGVDLIEGTDPCHELRGVLLRYGKSGRRRKVGVGLGHYDLCNHHIVEMAQYSIGYEVSEVTKEIFKKYSLIDLHFPPEQRCDGSGVHLCHDMLRVRPCRCCHPLGATIPGIDQIPGRIPQKHKECLL